MQPIVEVSNLFNPGLVKQSGWDFENGVIRGAVAWIKIEIKDWIRKEKACQTVGGAETWG